jgi:hypothetical protein
MTSEGGMGVLPPFFRRAPHEPGAALAWGEETGQLSTAPAWCNREPLRSTPTRATDRLRHAISARSIRARRTSFTGTLDRPTGSRESRASPPKGRARRRPGVLDWGCPWQRRRWRWVDRHQPGFDIGIALPGTNQAVCLDGLAAEDAQRRRDHRNAKSLPQCSSPPCKPGARSGP